MDKKLYGAIAAVSEAISRNKQFLTDLDAVIGDADHGINMVRGFDMVMFKLKDAGDEDIAGFLKKIGMTLISTVGGASGPLYGTAFLRAAGVMEGKKSVSVDDAAHMLATAIQGIKDRGKASSGEKTMLDALEPAYKAFAEGAGEGKPILACMELACSAALKGVEYTGTIKATKGRASYLGDRSIGHQDPGATSSYIMLRAVTDFCQVYCKEDN